MLDHDQGIHLECEGAQLCPTQQINCGQLLFNAVLIFLAEPVTFDIEENTVCLKAIKLPFPKGCCSHVGEVLT